MPAQKLYNSKMYKIPKLQKIYCGMGFKCEYVIIVNCDFSSNAQLLERNVYITYGCNQYIAHA